MTLGEKIREERLKRGWTQDEVAEFLGYKGRSSINKIETGVNVVPSNMIPAFMELFDLTAEELIDPRAETKFQIRLKQMMRKRKMRAVDLCKASGLSKPLISEYLNGKYEPKPEALYKLAKALDVDGKWLIGLTDEEPKRRTETMVTDVKVFENTEFGQLEVIKIDGKPYFPATDCAKMLGYVNPRKAIIDHCKGVTKCDSPINGINQTKNYIPEGDLYRLIIFSRLPAAEKFERWVFDEVLPTIRKQGYYGKPPKAHSLKEVVQLVQETRSIMTEAGNTPSEIAETIKGLGEQYGIQFPNFFVKPEETGLKDVFDMIDYIYSQPRGRGKPVPTYEGYVLFKINEQKKLEGESE